MSEHNPMNEMNVQPTNQQKNLGYFFSRSARRVPDKVCIIDLYGGHERRITYRSLDDRANRVAGMLSRQGITAGQRVAMLVGNRFEFIEIMFGVMRIGAIPVPTNIRLKSDILSFVVSNSHCSAAFVDPSCNDHAVGIVRNASVPHKFILDKYEPDFFPYEEELSRRSSFFAPPISEDMQAVQLYTSGSTGRPKGVIITHRGMLWYIAHNQKHWPVSEDDRGLIALPLFHKNALRGTVKPMLYAGGSFVIMPAYEPKAYLDALAKYRCTFSRGVAAVFAMFLQHKDYLKTLDLSALRRMEIGSGIVPKGLLDAVEKALPGVKATESYGSTEGGSPIRPPTDGRSVPRGSIGVPIPDIELKLINADGSENPSSGELIFRSPYVCLGYYNQPKSSREKIRDGWLHTGDIFSKDRDGFYFFCSRRDDMFSCGGENVYPKEVEDLLFTHPDVANAVVVPIQHAVKGFVPAAMIILRDSAVVEEAALKEFCVARGPAYAHPRLIRFSKSFPLNAAGKPDKTAIQSELALAYEKSTDQEALN